MINEKMITDLRELMRMKEELEAEITAIQDEIKAEMTKTGIYEMTGPTYKVTWNEITTNRIDQKALRAELPDIADRFTKVTTTRRFYLK